MFGSQGKLKFVLHNGRRAVEKRSQRVDNTIELEIKALRRLAVLDSPHFAKLLSSNRDMSRLTMEEIVGDDLLSLIKRARDSRGVAVIESMVGMTIAATEMARRFANITHNDLHTSNVLVAKTDVDVFVYRFGDREYRFRTFGRCPVIIDFGYACLSGEKVLASTSFTNIGYSVHEHDPLADSRILLCNVARVLKKCGHGSTPFVGAIDSMFGNLERGWFSEDAFINVTDELAEILDTNDIDLVELIVGAVTFERGAPPTTDKQEIEGRAAFRRWVTTCLPKHGHLHAARTLLRSTTDPPAFMTLVAPIVNMLLNLVSDDRRPSSSLKDGLDVLDALPRLNVVLATEMRVQTFSGPE